MNPLKIVSLWTISFLHVTFCLYPTTLTALANIQTQRAKAIANALALHNRAQYNAALARSRVNLAQLPRITRQSGAFILEDNDVDTSSSPEKQIWFEDDINIPNGVPELNNMDNLMLDERLGASSPKDYQDQPKDQRFFAIPNSGCSSQYVPVPEEETTNISVYPTEENNEKIDIRNNKGMLTEKNPNVRVNKKNICRVCKQNLDKRNKNSGKGKENVCPVCGNTVNPISGQDGSRQADFNDFHLEDRELPTFDPFSFAGPPEKFLIQDDINDNDFPNVQDERLANPEPHIHGSHKHGFVHTHTHFHGYQKLHSTPQTTIAYPPVKTSTHTVNVNSNQHTIVNPGLYGSSFVGPINNFDHGAQQLHESTHFGTSKHKGLQSGVEPHMTSPINSFDHGVQNLYESSHFGTNEHNGLLSGVGSLSFGISNHGVAQSTLANQGQFTEIHSRPSSLPLHGLNVNQMQSDVVNDGQTTINRNQLLHIGKNSESSVGGEVAAEPNFPKEYLNNNFNPQDEGSDRDEMVSTFLLPSIHIDPSAEYQPDYYPPSYFNPNKPQDRQPIVRYIEDEQKSIQKLLRFLQSRERKHHSHPQPSMNPTVYNHGYTYSKQEKQELPQTNYNYIPHPLPEYVPSSDEYFENDRNPTDRHEHSNNVYNTDYNFAYPEDNHKASEEINHEGNEETNQENLEDNTDENSQYRKSSTMRTNAKENQDKIVKASLNDYDFQFPQIIPGMIPTPISVLDLPRATDGLDPDTEQKLFSNYFKTEQRNVDNAIQQIQTEHQKNLNNLIRYLSDNTAEVSNGQLLNTPQLQNAPESKDLVGEPFPESMDFLMRDAEGTNNQEILNQDIEQLQEDPKLRYIFQVPTRYNYYKRQSRSINADDLDNLLLKEKEIIEKLKKYSKDDKDLMLIGYLGDNWINDLQQKINVRRNRVKRHQNNNLAWNTLLSDPKLRLDISKTLDNIGTATRTTLDYERLPMYHVKNMLGSAKDAVVAAIKIPNQPFVIPTTYEIVPNELHPDETVGAINPAIVSEANSISETKQSNKLPPTDNFGITFQRVGSMVRNSVQSGQEALGHIGNAANHAKKALHSARYMTPRVILKKMPTLAKEPLRQAMIVTPRIFDFIERDDEQVGSPLDQGITTGDLMNAIGLSNPNSNMELDKIIMQPRNSFTLQQRNNDETNINFDNFLGNIKVERMGSLNDDIIGDVLNSLHEAQMSFGVTSLKEFINKMKRNVQSMLRGNMLNRKIVPIKNEHDQTKQITEIPTESSSKTVSKTNKTQDEKLGVSLMPSGTILQPFMGRVSEEEIRDMLKEYQNVKPNLLKGSQTNHRESDLDPVLGAINPLLFERMFNERVQLKPNENIQSLPKKQQIEDPKPEQTIQHDTENDYTNKSKPEEDTEQVADIMKVKGSLLKPFMGKKLHKPTDKMEKRDHVIYEDYRPEYMEFEPMNEENSSYEDPASQYLRRK